MDAGLILFKQAYIDVKVVLYNEVFILYTTVYCNIFYVLIYALMILC